MAKFQEWNKEKFKESIFKKLDKYQEFPISKEIISSFIDDNNFTNIQLNTDMFITAFILYKVDNLKINYEEDGKVNILDELDKIYYFNSDNYNKVVKILSNEYYKKNKSQKKNKKPKTKEEIANEVRNEIIRYSYYILKIDYLIYRI